MLTGRVLQGHGGAQPLLLPLREQEEGLPIAGPSSHGVRPGVRRAPNQACLNQHDPGQEPRLPRPSSCPNPARPPPSPRAPVLLAVSLFFSGLVCRAVLTKAAVWPGVGGGSAAGGQDPALQFPGSAGRRQGVGLGAGLPGWGPGSPSRKHALEESNLRLWGHHADRPCGVPGRPQEESQALAKQWALLPHVPVWPCPAVHTPCPDTARAGLSQHVHSLESKGGGLRAVQPSVPG